MAAIYHEIVVNGDEKILKGFVRGFQLGRSIEGGFYLCGDHPIDDEHVRRLGLRGHSVHIVATPAVRKSFLAAFAGAPECGFEVVTDRPILRASFGFTFDTYSREVASAIKGILKNLPAGLQLLSYEPSETVDQKARGVELYSPAHDYRFEGKGKIEGDFAKLLAVRAGLDAIEVVEAGKIRFET